MSMRRPYQIVGAAFFVLAVAFARQALGMRFYSHLGPGPGFFPFWLAVALGIISIAMIAEASFRPCEPMPDEFVPARDGVVRIFAVVAALAMTAALIEPLGFRLTMFGALVFLLAGLGGQGWRVTLAIAFVGSFGAFELFDRWLRVALPIGFFGI